MKDRRYADTDPIRLSTLNSRTPRSRHVQRTGTDQRGCPAGTGARFEDGTTDTVQIGGGAAVLDRTLVTADSPLGRALLGRRSGDTVSFQAPEGPRSAVVVSLCH
ncbi:GreA/GreB family elongation factor [Streptomyces sp. NPDC005281]|uniref:GreA/GreB family elongation factor n=1 Tax=Streptomyces sp. NPDC005281 TaxID=3155712 RepID=UPI0033A26DDF